MGEGEGRALTGRPPIVYLSYDGAAEPLGQSQIVAYLERLAASFEVTLISFEKPTDDDARRAVETQLKRRGIRWRPLAYHRRPPVLSTALDVARGALALDRELRRRPDAVLHARSYVAAQMVHACPRARRAPFLFDIRGFWVDERVDGGIWRRGTLYRAVKAQERRLFRRADAVVTLTAASTDVVRRLSHGADLPVEVIPTCVDWRRFAGSARRAPGRHAVWTGSVGTWYRFDLAVRFAEVAGLPLTVMTRQVEEARAMTRGGAEVGWVPPAELPRRLHAGDVGLCLYKENFSRLACAPTRFAEYLAAGMPVAVTPHLGDVSEIVEAEQVGVVIDREDDEGLRSAAERLERLAADPATVERCREVARRRFDVEDGARRYAALYARLAAAEKLSAGAPGA